MQAGLACECACALSGVVHHVCPSNPYQEISPPVAFSSSRAGAWCVGRGGAKGSMAARKRSGAPPTVASAARELADGRPLYRRISSDGTTSACLMLASLMLASSSFFNNGTWSFLTPEERSTKCKPASHFYLPPEGQLGRGGRLSTLWLLYPRKDAPSRRARQGRTQGRASGWTAPPPGPV